MSENQLLDQAFIDAMRSNEKLNPKTLQLISGHREERVRLEWVRKPNHHTDQSLQAYLDANPSAQSLRMLARENEDVLHRDVFVQTMSKKDKAPLLLTLLDLTHPRALETLKKVKNLSGHQQFKKATISLTFNKVQEQFNFITRQRGVLDDELTGWLTENIHIKNLPSVIFYGHWDQENIKILDLRLKTLQPNHTSTIRVINALINTFDQPTETMRKLAERSDDLTKPEQRHYLNLSKTSREEALKEFNSNLRAWSSGGKLTGMALSYQQNRIILHLTQSSWEETQKHEKEKYYLDALGAWIFNQPPNSFDVAETQKLVEHVENLKIISRRPEEEQKHLITLILQRSVNLNQTIQQTPRLGLKWANAVISAAKTTPQPPKRIFKPVNPQTEEELLSSETLNFLDAKTVIEMGKPQLLEQLLEASKWDQQLVETLLSNFEGSWGQLLNSLKELS